MCEDDKRRASLIYQEISVVVLTLLERAGERIRSIARKMIPIHDRRGLCAARVSLTSNTHTVSRMQVRVIASVILPRDGQAKVVETSKRVSQLRNGRPPGSIYLS